MWDGRAQLEKKMIKRVSASQMVAQQAASSAPRNSFPRLQDILVNLSVKDAPKVVRRLKLIGDPYMFIEYTDKVYVPNPGNDPSLRGKTMKVPFPDAHLNKSFNRIGNDEVSQCPWKKMGYIGNAQFAQNVLEKQEDGSWEVKILKKGKSIFNRIAEQTIQNYEDQEPPLSVDYTLYFEGKPTLITDEMIEMLRKAGEPATADLERERLTYEADRKNDSFMPKWEDFFAYGYPLNKIFKFTPPRGEDIEVVEAPSSSSYTVKPPVSKPVVEDDEELVVPTPAPKKKVATPVFDEEEIESDDDELSLGWMGNK